jgi:hypothetical protein
VGDETFRRVHLVCIGSSSVPIAPLKDLFVMYTVAAPPVAPNHWPDALPLVSNQSMDWRYLPNISTGNSRKFLGSDVWRRQYRVVPASFPDHGWK